jgi:small subunit ribosomal protein S17
MGSQEKLQTGIVVSNKMDKTVVVRIDRSKRHRLYGKTLRVTQRYKAHDEQNECRLGDVVKIAETRPLSREKRWRVVEVVTTGDVAEVAPREIGASLLEETRAAAAAASAARAEARAVAEAAAARAAAEAESARIAEVESARTESAPSDEGVEAASESAEPEGDA